MPVSSSPPLEPPYLTAEEIEAFAPYAAPPSPAGRWARLKDRLEEARCYGPGQIGARRWSAACPWKSRSAATSIAAYVTYRSTPRRSGTSP
jgi:hypothetical protein